MAGRKPKPTALRLIEGNREHRTIRAELEPKPVSKAPPCPRELRKDARKAWRYLVRELGGMNCLASSDRGQMVGYCDAWGRWTNAQRRLQEQEQLAGGKDQSVIMSTGGRWGENPWLKISNRALADLIKYGAELGLNPVQRTRVKIEKAPAESRKAKLLG